MKSITSEFGHYTNPSATLPHLRQKSNDQSHSSNPSSHSASPSFFPTESHAMLDDSIANLLSSYAEKYSEQEPPLLQQLRKETQEVYPAIASRMLSGPSQGAFFSFLSSVYSVQSVLELGSFTGYSALCFAIPFEQFSIKSTNTATTSSNRIISQRRKEIHTSEIDSKAIMIAEKYFDQYTNPSAQVQ